MSYEPQKCHFCQSSDIRKHGIRNHIQHYKCNACNKTFTLKKKSNPINIWNDYSIGKQTYKQLALNRLREKGCIIQSITCDDRRGLMKDLFNTPVQMGQFHMVAIMMRKLRKNINHKRVKN